MVKSLENGTSLPPFLVKCYEMVSDESTDGLISWTESNDSFIIWDESKFSAQLLPNYFKHSNFSSFVRQLNIYGFRKIDADRWQFANEAFIKGQKHLLKNIKRRKHPQNAPHPNDTYPPPPPSSEEDKISKLRTEIENLKTDKNALMQELIRLRQHQKTSQNNLLVLRQQLKHMEMKQQQMLSFIVTAMQTPEFMVQFFHPKENVANNKLSDITDDCEPAPTDRAMVKYQPLMEGHEQLVDGSLTEASNCDDAMELDFSSDEMRDLLVDIDFLLGTEEERLFSFEDHSHVVLPDMPEYDAMLEQLLLSSNPVTENKQLSELQGENCPMGSDISNCLEENSKEHLSRTEEVSTCQGPTESSVKVEDLTKQIECLNSEIN